MSEPDPTATVDNQATEPEGRITRDEVRVHRGPRYFRFMLVAVIALAIVALILTFTFPEQQGYDPAQVFGFLLLAAIVAGIAIGSLVALLLDAIAHRRARLVAADRLDVQPHDPGADTVRPTADAATDSAGSGEASGTKDGEGYPI